MKKAIDTFEILSLLLFIIACERNTLAKQNMDPHPGWAQCEVIEGDTVNRIDAKGRKQGIWYILDRYKVKDTIVYKDGVVVK